MPAEYRMSSHKVNEDKPNSRPPSAAHDQPPPPSSSPSPLRASTPAKTPPPRARTPPPPAFLPSKGAELAASAAYVNANSSAVLPLGLSAAPPTPGDCTAAQSLRPQPCTAFTSGPGPAGGQAAPTMMTAGALGTSAGGLERVVAGLGQVAVGLGEAGLDPSWPSLMTVLQAAFAGSLPAPGGLQVCTSLRAYPLCVPCAQTAPHCALSKLLYVCRMPCFCNDCSSSSSSNRPLLKRCCWRQRRPGPFSHLSRRQCRAAAVLRHLTLRRTLLPRCLRPKQA